MYSLSGASFGDAVGLPLEPVVQPPLFLGVEVPERLRPEVHFPDARRCAQRMYPRTDDQPAAPCRLRASVPPHAGKAAQGVVREHVIPAAHQVGGRRDFRVRLGVGQTVPVIVPVRVAHPVLPERHVASGGLVERDDRQGVERLGPVVVVDALRGAGVGAHAPGKHHAELEGAARVGDAAVMVGAHHARGHARQVAAAQRRRRPLHNAQVGAADGAQLAVAPRLPPYPLLAVVAVLGPRATGRIRRPNPSAPRQSWITHA